MQSHGRFMLPTAHD
jgi:hypothetical protein